MNLDDGSEYSVNNRIFDPRNKPLPITREDFECITRARAGLDRINDIEFNFWAVVEAHRELVDCSLLLANEYAHHYNLDATSLHLGRARLGTRLDSFLVAFERCVSSAPGVLLDLGVKNAKSDYYSPVYDAHFEYRLCCKLRNYAAHKLSAGQGIYIERSRKPGAESGAISVSARMAIQELLSYKDLSGALKQELVLLQKMGKRSIDLSKVAQRACHCVWNIHSALRDTPLQIESDFRGDIDIYKTLWLRAQNRDVREPVLCASNADEKVWFDVEDDIAVERIRKLTAGISQIANLDVRSP